MTINKVLRESEYWEEIRTLIKTLDGEGGTLPASREALEKLVCQVSELIECDHVFFSLYDAEAGLFRATACKSSIQPGDIAREQKFMWDRYWAREAVLINNLSQYNHRLHRSAARIQMLSMAGVPVIGDDGIIGVLEVYSHKEGMFADTDVNILNLYARQLASLLRQMEQAQELRYLTAENSLLRLLLSSEKVPVSELLINLGMLFKTALPVEGIAVLASGGGEDLPVLTQVMGEGIPETSVKRLMDALTAPFLSRLIQLPEGAKERYLVTSSAQGTGSRTAYIVPIAWRQRLYGLIVFYCRELEGRSQERLLRFVKQITLHVGSVFDRKHAYSHMQRISLTDALTGLSNRRLFDYALAREFKQVKRSGKPLSLLFVDIDFFKKINDQYGHSAGDMVLAELGAQLAASFRGTDIIARYGGEEFAVILPETDRQGAMMIAERLREDVAGRKFTSGGLDFSVTVSVGIATYYAGSENEFPNMETLVWAADQALYRAKELGRNLTIVWSGI